MANISIGHARVSAAAGVVDSQSHVLAWILTSAAMLLALMVPALWNVTQFFTFRTEVGVEDNAPTVNMFAGHFPQLFAQFMRARQQAERFDVAPLNYLHVPVAALAVAGLVLALLFRRRLKIAPDVLGPPAI